MAIRQLRYMGDAVLRKRAKPVVKITDETRELIDDMIETMYFNEGVGLAAPQVGVSQRVIVYDNVAIGYGTDPQALINPEIVEASGSERCEEGCLSIPEIKEVVDRFQKIKVTGLDRDGRELEVEAEGLAARIIQHEIDHINGVLFVDRLGAVKKKLAVSRWKKVRKELEAQQSA
ncbi:MAG TPA: peptide deformylase [Candidatus Glassbacteria bacterium]|nr:peptide deformylase [Candidatus Glassbacteria bacterium]